MRSAWAVGLVIAVACGQEATRPAVAPARPAAPAAAAPVPVSAEQDALWALAPAGARIGVVATPRGAAMIERGWLAAQDLLASSVDLAELNSQLMHALLTQLGTPSPSLAEFGLTHDKGFAAFVVGATTPVVVVPIADRDKFVARFHGTRGADGDIIGAWVCKPVATRYVCSERRALLGQLGQGGLAAVRRSVATRGDVELVIRPVGAAGAPTTAAAVQLTPGAVLVHATLTHVPDAIGHLVGAPSRLLPGAAAAAAFGVLDLTPYRASLPATPLVPGLSLTQLAGSIGGPVAFAIPAGTTDLALRIPLADPSPARLALEHCAEISPLMAYRAAYKDGACAMATGPLGVATTLWIEGNELHVGSRTPGKPTPIAPSPLAAELARGSWSIALFARGSQLANRRPGADMVSGMNAEAALYLRGMLLANELGLAIRRDGDALHLVAGVRTAWNNPADVVAKLLAITPADISSGKAVTAARAIAAAAASSPFADDVRVGEAGLRTMQLPIFALTSIVVPAVLDQLEAPPAAAPAP